MADSQNSVMITPLGEVCNCEHFCDDYHGTIYSLNKLYKWDEYNDYLPKCSFCPALPTCFKLKRCPTRNPQCDEFMQKLQINKIVQAMPYTFKKFNQQ